MFNTRPAIWKIISEVTAEDSRVRLVGRIVELNENFMILDDGTGTILVNNNSLIQNTKLNDVVLIIGNIHQRSDGKLVLEAETSSSFNNFNMELYLKTYDLIKKYR
jgi:hypothetical protein